jgi:hypothetical protein
MKRSSMIHGKFRMKNSPYPETYVCDYPSTTEALSYLEGLLLWLLDESNVHNMPLDMVKGLAYKAEEIQKSLSNSYNKTTKTKSLTLS